MTNEFTKYKEILLLNRGDVVKATSSIIACQKPTTEGWTKGWISMGTRLRVMSTSEDAITAVISTETGYKYVTIFCDQWSLLSVVNEKENSND